MRDVSLVPQLHRRCGCFVSEICLHYSTQVTHPFQSIPDQSPSEGTFLLWQFSPFYEQMTTMSWDHEFRSPINRHTLRQENRRALFNGPSDYCAHYKTVKTLTWDCYWKTGKIDKNTKDITCSVRLLTACTCTGPIKRPSQELNTSLKLFLYPSLQIRKRQIHITDYKHWLNEIEHSAFQR